MTILLIIGLTLTAVAASYLYASNRLLVRMIQRQDRRVGKLQQQFSALLDRLLIKHGQEPLSQPVTQTTQKVEPMRSLYRQRLEEGEREDEEEARQLGLVPTLDDDFKRELVEEARRRA